MISLLWFFKNKQCTKENNKTHLSGEVWNKHQEELQQSPPQMLCRPQPQCPGPLITPPATGHTVLTRLSVRDHVESNDETSLGLQLRC